MNVRIMGINDLLLQLFSFALNQHAGYGLSRRSTADED